MIRRTISTSAAIALCALVLSPATAEAQSAKSIAGAGQGAFPAGAAWNGIPLSSLGFGTGVALRAAGAAFGTFEATIASTSVAGVARNILVSGQATSAASPSSFSGTCSLDLGDGTPAQTVPFSVTFATDPAGTVTLALSLNGQPLPVAVVSNGSYGVQ